MSPTFASLRIRNYRRYAAGMIVSNTGTWMQRVAQDWLVLQLSGGSAIAVGVTTGLQFLPLLLFGLFGGVIADRYDKRRILMLTNAFLGLVAATLSVLVLSGAAEVWHVYLLAFALGLGTAVDNPARQTLRRRDGRPGEPAERRRAQLRLVPRRPPPRPRRGRSADRDLRRHRLGVRLNALSYGAPLIACGRCGWPSCT